MAGMSCIPRTGGRLPHAAGRPETGVPALKLLCSQHWWPLCIMLLPTTAWPHLPGCGSAVAVCGKACCISADWLRCWLLPLGSVLCCWEPCCWMCETHLSAVWCTGSYLDACGNCQQVMKQLVLSSMSEWGSLHSLQETGCGADCVQC